MNSTHSLVVAPLLPFTVTWIDIFLPPLLIALSLLLHTLYNTPPLPSNSIHAHLYRARTAHARYLPIEAKHVFSYPVLFFGLDLDALESGEIEMGRLFGFNPRGWRLTALRSRVYLEPGKGTEGIREKLWRHLEQRGVREEQAKRVYTVTMPGLVGLQDINPLTVHYCYSEEEKVGRKLEVVVLEVSNTFGEKHLYVLKVAEVQDEKVDLGYEHQWTFPRAFHVSPFNDRSGFYRVFLSDPLRSNSPSLHLPSNPELALKIITLTSDGEKKLFASLSGPSAPLQPSTLLGALLRWPFSLLLTTPRILYQAMLLHYGHRLDVFPRPDPFVETGEAQELSNPVESGGKDGSVQWQEEGGFESLARERIVVFLERRVRELHEEGRRVEIVIQPADRTRPPIVVTSPPSSAPLKTLTISYLTPLFFSDLLASPTIPLALALGSKTEHRWRTSNDELFLSIFSSPKPAPPSTFAIRQMQQTRLAMMRWGFSFSPSSSSSANLVPAELPPHPLDDATTSLSTVFALRKHFFILKLGYWIFVATKARFVKGTEPWEEWARWSAKEGERKEVVEKGEVRFGSVLRP
ncbi:hypothetical protein BCR35DRAFT_285076 [Leucosporidium creatinivorum]|uniref:Uncharacterized protein n=1 Tax=Leucosporidium creatinivorum TaxID=106004 RepID=A0A1Y2CR57_9BASI|nr:hypothetical protein BCR35DRAFT_285076 [Leucosporidium creatinivorum]